MTEAAETKEPRPLISGVRIENFRSIVQADVQLGRVTVVVGANGSGKSNLLEAVAVAGASAAGKLDHEFLAARGIRPVSALVVPHFPDSDRRAQPRLEAGEFELALDSAALKPASVGGRALELIEAFFDRLPRDSEAEPEVLREFRRIYWSTHIPILGQFLIYTPDYPSLRTFADEGQILPLGIRGEGLFAHLVWLSRNHPDIVARIGEHLRVLDWFDGFVIPNDLGPGEKRLAIRDRYLAADVLLDQRAANEGFLFLLFVYTLLLSPKTPRFFAIDNADASLNPLLCARVMADVAALAKEQDKQVILTTHNPALLDGLDLADDEQRLLVCERDLDGHTQFRRVAAPRDTSIQLSEAFLRGYLGGLPKSF